MGSFVSMCAVHAREDMDRREKKVPRASSSAWRFRLAQSHRSRFGTRIRDHRGGTIKTPQTQHPQWVLESSLSFRSSIWHQMVGPRSSRLHRFELSHCTMSQARHAPGEEVNTTAFLPTWITGQSIQNTTLSAFARNDGYARVLCRNGPNSAMIGATGNLQQ